MLLVSLVDENGLDIEEKLLSSVYEKREEEKDGGKDTSADEATFSGTIASPELTTMTVCVTFVSPYGAVYGHDVSPGQ